ncbi:hypothetical protein EV361DRAFT_941450 [Lentinula raphanica]|nr:hypothetical protein EV361DRAFT_941450 [Lentinula raphanica]
MDRLVRQLVLFVVSPLSLLAASCAHMVADMLLLAPEQRHARRIVECLPCVFLWRTGRRAILDFVKIFGSGLASEV